MAIRTASPGSKGPRPDTRTAVFQAAAAEFSARGFDGVGVDDIAERAKVNKAMIYYHFADKLALYRAVVGDMLATIGTTVTEIAAADLTPADKLNRFIEQFVRHADARPWFPTLMLREIAAGAPHLDLETLTLMKAVFLGFGKILADGAAAGTFRPVHPVLAYTSIVGPLLMNAARERMAAEPGRSQLPMFVAIPHQDLIAHLQLTAQRMLEPR
ncbi:MAG: TetR/AcrR family transcriptional regulator [Acidobacteriota bacterium]|nr:TetR/AcrR family transcriptional regulator [Acidobacteriota bacterium]